MSNIKNEMDMLSAMIGMLGGVGSTLENSAVCSTHLNPVESTRPPLSPVHRNPEANVECRDYEGHTLSFCGMPHCVSKREWIRAQNELKALREWKATMEAKLEKAKYVKKISARKAREEKAMRSRTQPQ